MKNDKLKVHIFTEGLSKKTYAFPALRAFAEGVEASGDEARLITKRKYEPCDVAVIFGDVRNGKGKERRMPFKAEIKGRHIRRGLVVIDTAILTRATPVGALYRRIGIDGLLRDEGDFANGKMPDDRWQKISAHAGLHIQPWRKDGKNIIIALQRPIDASLRSSEARRPLRYKTWLLDLVKTLRQHTDAPLYIRPHPASTGQPIEESWLGAVRQELPEDIIWDTSGQPFDEALKDCLLCITYNSGAGVDATLSGVPVLAGDPGSFAWDVALHDISQITDMPYPDRMPWLYNLSYVEWNLEEIAQGLPWRHLRPRLLEQL